MEAGPGEQHVSFAQEAVHQLSALCIHVDWSSYIPRECRVQRGIKEGSPCPLGG